MIKILEAMRPLVSHGEELPIEDWEDIVGFLRVFIDRCHHGKEERVLFPAVLQVAGQETRALIEQLLVEHNEGRRLVAALASAVGVEHAVETRPPAERQFDAARADEAIDLYVVLMRPHVASEEKHLFPVANGLFAPEVAERLQEEYDRIEEEVIGVGRHEAFELTVERLTDSYLPQQGRTHGFFG
jgi:hemerythrin-like domain-containing protein